jgi:Zn-dependent peptidase ImmA (M78 family)
MARAFYNDSAALLDDLGITEPDEIMIEALAAHCGATIIEQPLSGCEARLIGYGDKAIITVNSSSSIERRRFSAAHELGHWVRDKGRVAAACSEEMLVTRWQDKDRETSANRFAANLLLPDRIFRPRAKNRPITLHTVQELGFAFKTSITATAIRVVELGSIPGWYCAPAPKDVFGL